MNNKEYLMMELKSAVNDLEYIYSIADDDDDLIEQALDDVRTALDELEAAE